MLRRSRLLGVPRVAATGGERRDDGHDEKHRTSDHASSPSAKALAIVAQSGN
jgi:hypothetical protein